MDSRCAGPFASPFTGVLTRFLLGCMLGENFLKKTRGPRCAKTNQYWSGMGCFTSFRRFWFSLFSSQQVADRTCLSSATQCQQNSECARTWDLAKGRAANHFCRKFQRFLNFLGGNTESLGCASWISESHSILWFSKSNRKLSYPQTSNTTYNSVHHLSSTQGLSNLD